MKKFVVLILTAALLLSLAVCANASSTYIYNDTEGSNKLSFPKDWSLEYMDHDVLKVKFIPNGSDSASMIYGSADYWSMLSDRERSSLQRSDVDNGYASKSDVAGLIGCSVSDITMVTVNGTEYYQCNYKHKNTYEDFVISIDVTCWVYFHNGWVYVYQYAGSDSLSLYDDFQDIVASATYGQSTKTTPALQTKTMQYLGGTYTGSVKDNLPHGEGALCWGLCTYNGNFSNGYPSGEGTFYFSDGDIFTSSSWGWVNTSHRSWVPSRQGADMYYTGMTSYSTPAGYGTLNFSSGGSYAGEFVDGDPQGWGIYTYRSPRSDSEKYKESTDWTTVYENKRLKHTYTGLKIADKWQGFGIGIMSSGYAYCGEVKNDKRDGHGELYTPKDKLEAWGVHRGGGLTNRYALP